MSIISDYPWAAFAALYLVSPYQSNYWQSSHKLMGESGTHMPTTTTTSHWRNSPALQMPLPTEQRHSPLQAPLQLSQVTPVLPWDMGTKALPAPGSQAPADSLHFQHLPCSVGTHSQGQWPTEPSLVKADNRKVPACLCDPTSAFWLYSHA